eukprot:4685086-Amphidinium_carterae.1
MCKAGLRGLPATKVLAKFSLPANVCNSLVCAEPALNILEAISCMDSILRGWFWTTTASVCSSTSTPSKLSRSANSTYL